MKYFFIDSNNLFSERLSEDMSYSLKIIVEEMKDYEIDSIIVYSAKILYNTNTFPCLANENEDSEKGLCNILNCPDYSPKNKKSGCCKYRGYYYEADKKYELFVNGKLKLLEQ